MARFPTASATARSSCWRNRRALIKTVRTLVRSWPLRGYDAIQLACAVKLRDEAGAVALWCADGELAVAARGEGLRTTVL